MSATSITWSIAYLTSRASLPLLEAALWGALAALALGATWWIANRTWMREGSPTRRAVLILPTYVVAAFVRSMIPVLAGGSVDGPRQLLFAVASVTILSIAATLAVNSYRELEIQNGRLAAIRDALAASESRAQVEAATLRSSARQAITTALEQALADDAIGEERAVRLRRVSDDVVRPLSHAISGQQDEAPPTAPERPRRDLRALSRAILAAEPIRPWATASLVTVMSLGTIFMIMGAPWVFFVAAAFWAALALLLWAFERLPWQRLPVWLGLALLALAFAATGSVTVMLLRLWPASMASVPRGPVIVAVMTVIAGGLIAVLSGITQQQRWLEEELISEGRVLVTARRATQARIRRDRRHLARILHGVIQPRIVARSLQLQASGDAAEVDDDLARELDEILSGEAEAERSIDVTRALSDIADVWSGSKTIVEVTSPQELNASLVDHPATARALVDVTCEAVNNAILRAGAARVHAVVSASRDAVTVVVTNDISVTEATARRGRGLGSTLFDELTDEWSLTSEAGRAEFVAVISLPRSVAMATPEQAHLAPPDIAQP